MESVDLNGSLLAFAALFFWATVSRCANPGAAKPNVLFICVGAKPEK